MQISTFTVAGIRSILFQHCVYLFKNWKTDTDMPLTTFK